VLSGVKGPPRLDYKSRLDALATLWHQNGQSFALEETTPPASPTISINRVLYTTITDLIQTHEETRFTRNEAAQRLFETMAPENRELRVALRPIMRQWLDVTEWFMGNAHDSGRIDEDCDEDHLSGQFELFEATLYGIVGKFFSTVRELDEILEDANPDQVYWSTVFWTHSVLKLCGLSQQTALLMSDLGRRSVAMPPNQPGLIVLALKRVQRQTEVFHGIKGLEP
jgi:hypothetical protein